MEPLFTSSLATPSHLQFVHTKLNTLGVQSQTKKHCQNKSQTNRKELSGKTAIPDCRALLIVRFPYPNIFFC